MFYLIKAGDRVQGMVFEISLAKEKDENQIAAVASLLRNDGL